MSQEGNPTDFQNNPPYEEEIEKALENRLALEGRALETLFKNKNISQFPDKKEVKGSQLEMVFATEEGAREAYNTAKESKNTSIKLKLSDNLLIAELSPEIETELLYLKCRVLLQDHTLDLDNKAQQLIQLYTQNHRLGYLIFEWLFTYRSSLAWQHFDQSLSERLSDVLWRLREEQIDLSVRYPQYLGKYIRTDFEGNVIQVSDQPFLFGKQVKFNFPQLPKDHPDWDNPPF